ncbi:3-dehydroquinate synthase [Caulobacter vibrioides]|nr:3-dehydroquinate synthase [Caulobacter vibrioides]
MSVFFEISASSGAYQVVIERGAFGRLLQPTEDRVVIADEYFVPQIEALGHKVIPIFAAETSKELARIPEIISRLREMGASRKTTLVAIGGGVVQDVAGFVASVYMRGMPWIYMPTTLLGMADSCIGGKSSINVGRYKNLVGTFYPPGQISIDPELAATLSVEQRVAGLAEAAKIAYCRGEDAFSQYMAMGPTVHSETAALTEAVQLSLGSKKWFIEVDEFDRGERLLLNFGHTFGHAIEAASHFRISHGVAVAVGMLAALKLGGELGRHYDTHNRVHALKGHVEELLGSVSELGAAAREMTLDDLMAAFEADKKHSAGHYALIVVREDGDVERLLMERTPRSAELVRAAFAGVLERFGS